MLATIRTRLLLSVPLLLIVTLVSFVLNSLSPSDLARTILGADGTQEQYLALRHELGLDRSVLIQYASWLGNALSGDLGASYLTKERVLSMLNPRLGVTLSIMTGVMLVCVSLGLLFGVLSALRGGWIGKAIDVLSLVGLMMPSFLVALLFIMVFAVWLRWLPATGYVPFSEDALGNLRCFVLPALTLALAEWPVLMRVLRSDMIATLQEDYIAMAKAKGLKPRRILLVHALKPSSLTLVTVAGINIGRLIGGAVIVESVFALPGIGRLLIGAIYTRDFMILQGVVLFVAAGFVIVNFLVDMLYAVLDPRIRHAH
jgi:peptide/nickel transport system permease protein